MRVSRYYDRPASELEHIDLHDDRVTYVEAATIAGVPEATVRQWKSRHDLEPVGIGDDGRLLFVPMDVLRAEAKTRTANTGRKRQAR